MAETQGPLPAQLPSPELDTLSLPVAAGRNPSALPRGNVPETNNTYIRVSGREHRKLAHGRTGLERDWLSLYTFLDCLHFVNTCMYYLSKEDEKH